jgi:hypothetical protein
MKLFDSSPDTWEQIHFVHETCYTYSQPVQFLPHRLVLRLREGHDVRLHSLNLTTSPPSTIRWHRDMLDNSIAHAEFRDQPPSLLWPQSALQPFPVTRPKTNLQAIAKRHVGLESGGGENRHAKF